jgi:Spy/CpxP family protein refolding chaperone
MSYISSTSLFGNVATTTSTATSNSLRLFSDLDLTEDQRTKIRSIFKNATSQGLSQSEIQSQINAVLTPAQLTKFEDDIASAAASNSTGSDAAQKNQGPPPAGGNPFADPNGPFANLNLTSDQQTQIAKIFADAKSQGLKFDQINAKISAILTTSQQATFTTDLQNLPAPPSAPGSSDASTASASVSGQSQSGSDGTTTSSSGVTETDIQNQIAAATSLVLKQLQYDLSALG